MFKYAVLGLGRQGVASVYDLYKNCEAEEISVFDINRDTLYNSLDRLEDLGVNQIRHFRDQDQLWRHLSDNKYNVIISCASYAANLGITKKAIDLEIPYCDLGGNSAAVEQQSRLPNPGIISIVPDCGLAPGIINILVVYLSQMGLTHIESRCGGLPKPEPNKYVNPLKYKLVFDPKGLVSEYSGECYQISSGKIVKTIACEGVEDFEDHYDCFYTSNITRKTTESMVRHGVQNYNYKTIRYKGHIDVIRGWNSLGFLKRDKTKDDELIKLLNSNPELKFNSGKFPGDEDCDTDKVVLSVSGKSFSTGIEKNQRIRIEISKCLKTNFSAMEMMTSWGVTIIAHVLAKRAENMGFISPVDVIGGGELLSNLDKRISHIFTNYDCYSGFCLGIE